ncbi:MAG: hypothetical protein MJZ73_06800 [Bacteroidaceae bacterium]|nr:hypothetical protein [Bacteroidaceae bacterium]
MCISLMILFFVLYEAGFIALYKWARENNPEMTLWVIMGSKVCKIIAAGIMLVFVRLLTDEPLVRFGIIMLVVLLLSVLIESAYCLRNRVK